MCVETVVAWCPYFLLSDVFGAVCSMVSRSSSLHLPLRSYGINCFWLYAELFTAIFRSFHGMVFLRGSCRYVCVLLLFFLLLVFWFWSFVLSLCYCGGVVPWVEYLVTHTLC
jgi:hypothetical protein